MHVVIFKIFYKDIGGKKSAAMIGEISKKKIIGQFRERIFCKSFLKEVPESIIGRTAGERREGISKKFLNKFSKQPIRILMN